MQFVKYLFLAFLGVNLAVNAQETKPGKVAARKGVQCPKLKLKNGRVKNRFRGRQASFRCRSGYTLVGKSFAVCLGRDWSHPVPICVAPTCPPFTDLDKKNLQVAQWYAGALLKFSCPPGFEIEGSDVLLCDGRSWNGTVPACKYVPPANGAASVACDFEENLCGWLQDSADHADWRRHRGQTPSAYTGPTYDHTTNSTKGFYIYLESSDTAAGQKARLVTRVLGAETQERCFQFWYHMQGPSPKLMGDLNIYIKPVGLPEVLLFHKNGTQSMLSDEWQFANVHLPAMLQEFQIVIEAVEATHYAGSYVSDIAVDDVNLTSCPIKQTSVIQWPTPSLTTPTTKKKTSTPVSTVTTAWTTLTPFTPTMPSLSAVATSKMNSRPTEVNRSTTESTGTIGLKVLTLSTNSKEKDQYKQTKHQSFVSTVITTPLSSFVLNLTTGGPPTESELPIESVSVPPKGQESQSNEGDIEIQKSTERNPNKRTLIFIIFGIIGGSLVMVFLIAMSVRYVSQRRRHFHETSLNDDLHPITASNGTPRHSSTNSENPIEMF
ncbi:MAM and LDL-receptor class A domain-containing protein 1-like [Lingula anatina]|uniref:MAM and LDL-receptor class A domain-containing protein 1-like n=1 Tax=Lingula anatina TaxID=7574 RepID=A0A1S3JZ14_LINAN|nr:MAM and LDL-receptor class A domain-containing protein 1-like [Lingula anatina]|eukprot:XP_013415633.1 MAM and LDL-receptor class A domain-containing protein 1-like [Lingula anatina]